MEDMDISRHALEILGTLTGIAYLWLEYRASIYLWIAGIIMPAIYIFVYYEAGLYADFGINVYYLAAAVYGWWVWKYGGRRRQAIQPADRQTPELPISSMPARYYAALLPVTAALFAAICYILMRFTDSTVPVLDAFTTALSIAAMWMLARKYVEQWWVWVVVDVVSAGLYVYKELYPTAALYALYAVIALFGFRKWKRMMGHSS
ncbi:MAG: nicotinamide riboside transporter PnuC [Prevotellaceae bacterium]|jgi:nicotinamide mononucleotide transporter|nr:nicotinamide riboside transporter PnuC [Prevotellaceae bacterium]